MTLLSCSICEEKKSTGDFYQSKQHTRGYMSWCKSCHSEKNRRYHSPVTKRLRNLKSKYNLTKEDFQKLLETQDFKCALCNKTFVDSSQTLHICVDHNHNCCSDWWSCGKCVRGLLCKVCNTQLGHYEKMAKNPRLKSYLGIES